MSEIGDTKNEHFSQLEISNVEYLGPRLTDAGLTGELLRLELGQDIGKIPMLSFGDQSTSDTLVVLFPGIATPAVNIKGKIAFSHSPFITHLPKSSAALCVAAWPGYGQEGEFKSRLNFPALPNGSYEEKAAIMATILKWAAGNSSAQKIKVLCHSTGAGVGLRNIGLLLRIDPRIKIFLESPSAAGADSQSSELLDQVAKIGCLASLFSLAGTKGPRLLLQILAKHISYENQYEFLAALETLGKLIQTELQYEAAEAQKPLPAISPEYLERITIIVGNKDEYINLNKLKALCLRLSIRLHVIPQAKHMLARTSAAADLAKIVMGNK
jgi:hypothetical protein